MLVIPNAMDEIIFRRLDSTTFLLRCSDECDFVHVDVNGTNAFEGVAKSEIHAKALAIHVKLRPVAIVVPFLIAMIRV